MLRTSARPRGLAMAVVLVITMLVAILVSAVGTLGVQDLQFQSRSMLRQRAVYAAQAGLQDAYSRLLSNTSWNGTSPALANQTLQHITNDTYTVTVTNNSSGNSTVTASDGTQVPSGCVYFSSQGQVNVNDFVWWQKHCTATQMVSVGGVWSTYGLYANSFNLAGTNLFDSYNSSSGDYVEPNISFTLWPSIGNGFVSLNAHDKGSSAQASVGTNSTTSGAINITGSAYIDGNLSVGVGGDPDSVVSGINLTDVVGKTISGTASAMRTAWPEPTVTAPSSVSGPNTPFTDVTAGTLNSGVLSPGTYHNLDLGALSSVTLTGGVYHFTGNISSSVAASLHVQANSGAVTIYYDGDWNTESAVITIDNPSKLASNLKIYNTATSSSNFRMLGISGSAYMAVYAPKAALRILGNTEIMGAFIADTVESVGGFDLHYDTALASQTNPAVLQSVSFGLQ